MEMSGKEDAAVKDLECYISCKSKGSEEIYKARLVLVEMLIYQVSKSPINSSSLLLILFFFTFRGIYDTGQLILEGQWLMSFFYFSL